MLEGIYRDVPGVVVRACETRRVGIQFGTVRLLIDVRDLLIPYRRFGAWCEACGFQYNSVKTAIRRYELLLLESGQALTRANGTPIKPRTRQNEPSEQERAAWKPLTLVLCRDEFVSEQMFNSGFVRWLNRQTTQDGYQDKLRARCLQLAGYLIRAARTRTIESTSDE
jgi:hypothetical protein